MHKRHGLGLSQTLPSSSRPQTQLRVLADICEEERDYREADIRGTRLFVTGLPSSVDDIRLYLAFEEYGRVLEAQVAKPGLHIFSHLPVWHTLCAFCCEGRNNTSQRPNDA